MPVFCENTKSFANSIQTQTQDLAQTLIILSTSHQMAKWKPITNI